MSVVEVISFCLCNYIIDHPSFGRKKTVIYLFLLIGLMNLLLLLFSSESNFVLLVVFVAVKVFITTCFMVNRSLLRPSTPIQPKSTRPCSDRRPLEYAPVLGE